MTIYFTELLPIMPARAVFVLDHINRYGHGQGSILEISLRVVGRTTDSVEAPVKP